jgi:hypothetical protein
MDVPPPAKSLSGSGITCGNGATVGAGKLKETVLPNGCRMPMRSERANFQFLESGV